MCRERIRVDNLTIAFRHPLDQTRTLVEKAREFFRRARENRKPRVFKSLSDVSVTVREGDIVGVIGPNGGGKTTLLRAIAGIYRPDAGSVTCDGEVSTLLSLGTGFDNNLSGLDNIRLNGLVMGMRPDEIEAKVEEIVNFAEIADHIHAPMKVYSNGMTSRLSFAIVLAMRPDILLIDEVFSVGDLAFRQKSERAMRDLLDQAACQLIVTHNLEFVRSHCNRALYIAGGRVMMDGAPDEVVDAYSTQTTARKAA